MCLIFFYSNALKKFFRPYAASLGKRRCEPCFLPGNLSIGFLPEFEPGKGRAGTGKVSQTAMQAGAGTDDQTPSHTTAAVLKPAVILPLTTPEKASVTRADPDADSG